MHRLIKHFAITFSVGLLGGFLIGITIYDFKFGLILGTIVGIIFGLFGVGFTERVLASKSFEITADNKNPKIGLKVYEAMVREQISNMGFQFHCKKDAIEIFTPRALYKIFEPNVELEVNPYYIRVIGSRLFIRLISSYTEIEEL